MTQVLSLVLACNISKQAKIDGKYLYENKVQVREKDIARFYVSGLESQIKQRPNKKFLGLIRGGLTFYSLGSGEKDNRLKRFLRFKLGEPPVILDTGLIESSMRGMTTYLKAQGFYYSKVQFTVTGKPQKGKVTYLVQLGRPYVLAGVETHIPDRKMEALLLAPADKNDDESILENGNRLRLEDILQEQTRVFNFYRNRGYYSFSKDNISFDVDTSIGDFRAKLGINLKNPPGFENHKPFSVRKIFVSIDPLTLATDSLRTDSFKLRSFTYIPNGFNLKPNAIEQLLFVTQDSLFNQRSSNATFGRLNDLQIFRSVTVSALSFYPKTDSAYLYYQIKLIPNKKFNFSVEPQTISTDQSNLVTQGTYKNYGIATNLIFNVNNIFHGAEVLQLRYRISVEAQRGPSVPSKPLFNSYESSLSGNLMFPKFLFFQSIDRWLVNSNNRTILASSLIFEHNTNWIRNVVTIGLNYQSSRKIMTWNFAPAEVSFIQTSFANSDLEAQSKNNPYLQSIFANNLITDTRIGFIRSNQYLRKNKSFYYLRWDMLELAGNGMKFLYDHLGGHRNDSGYYSLLGVRFFNYVKSYADYRFNHYLDANDRLVYRIAAGFALPYGNSPDFVPFDKRFFTGGANSIRAFYPRSIGPGSYSTDDQLDRSGDVKIEANIEYRFNLFNKIIEGAMFCDAGNIWRIKEDGRPGAVFKPSTFYKQLAIGTGVGVRLNLDFLIFRIDAAFPLHDPRMNLSKFDELEHYSTFMDLWLKTIFNFGVGYPF